MLLFYATRDGQSRRIAAHIAARLAEGGISAFPHDLAGRCRAPAEPRRGPIGCSWSRAVRYGRHLPEAERFLRDPPGVAGAAPRWSSSR